MLIVPVRFVNSEELLLLAISSEPLSQKEKEYATGLLPPNYPVPAKYTHDMDPDMFGGPEDNESYLAIMGKLICYGTKAFC